MSGRTRELPGDAAVLFRQRPRVHVPKGPGVGGIAGEATQARWYPHRASSLVQRNLDCQIGNFAFALHPISACAPTEAPSAIPPP
jgi:hypothetical protein